MAKKEQKDWFDVMLNEDAPENPTIQLPDDNEKEGEDNGQGSEAAGALSEDGDSQGITNEPRGEDEITGTESTEYDDFLKFMDEDDSDDDKGEGGDDNGEGEG